MPCTDKLSSISDMNCISLYKLSVFEMDDPVKLFRLDKYLLPGNND